MFSSMNITTIPSVLYHLKCLKPFSLSMEAFLTTSINDLYTLIIHNYDPSLTTFQPTWFIPLIFPYIESNWSKHVKIVYKLVILTVSMPSGFFIPTSRPWFFMNFLGAIFPFVFFFLFFLSLTSAERIVALNFFIMIEYLFRHLYRNYFFCVGKLGTFFHDNLKNLIWRQINNSFSLKISCFTAYRHPKFFNFAKLLNLLF